MAKTGLSIKILGDPILRKKAKAVARVTDRHRRLLDEMARFMGEARGIGLAAPQVGSNERLIVVNIGDGFYKLINPAVTEREGEQTIEEGCLSVPGVYIKIKRSRKVTVEGLDGNGRPLRVEAEGLLACVFQHEIDHLDGRLICDYLPLLKRITIEHRMKEFKEALSGDGLPEKGAKPERL